MFWDAAFGTRFFPSDRHCPAELGIGTPFPPNLVAQLVAPFQRENFSPQRHGGTEKR
jgi:hypothetical protein